MRHIPVWLSRGRFLLLNKIGRMSQTKTGIIAPNIHSDCTGHHWLVSEISVLIKEKDRAEGLLNSSRSIV